MSSNRVEKLLNEVDDYEETISAIITFSHAVRWDGENGDFKKDSHYFIGRKMDTSSSNRKLPNNKITPDLIVQLDDTNGIIGEAKKFPREKDYWFKIFEQLQKYDDDLKGWKTVDEFIDISDIVLLTHYSRKTEVSDYIQKKISTGEIFFNKKFTIIVFSRVIQNKTFIYLEKGFGNLTNQKLNEKFRQIMKIPLEILLPLYKIKFYDSKPPLPYTMSILWDNVFNQIPKVEQFMDAGGRRQILIEVNINDLTKMIREQFALPQNNDDRIPEIPKTSWIREAMDMFIKLKYANKKIGSNEDYIIKYKSMKNPLETFALKVIEDKQQSLNDYED